MATGRTLSDDIYLLAGTLGDVLTALAGPEAFALEEEARGLAKASRAGDHAAGDQLAHLIAGIDLPDARTLTRAFTSYFQLINLAEDNERIRRIRLREESGTPRRGSAAEAISLIAGAGVSATTMQELLNQAEVRLVLTAHPTEAKRRTVIAKLARIFSIIRGLDERRSLAEMRDQAQWRLAATIAELWASDEIRAVTPTVLDELHANLVYLQSTLVDVIPRLYRDLEAALRSAYPDTPITVPSFLRFGSWIGGDRDGNPNVTPAMTIEVLSTMRAAALGFLDARLLELAGRISVSEQVVPAPAGVPLPLQPILDDGAVRFPELAAHLATINAEEPYRRALTLMRHRVQLAQQYDPNGYGAATELGRDLAAIRESLLMQHAELIALGDLHDVIRQVDVFGFHFAQLEVRDHARRYAATVAEALARSRVTAGYAALPEAERIAVLSREIANPRPLIPTELSEFGPEPREVIETFRMMRGALDGPHPGAIRSVIISGCESASDALGVLLLMKEAQLAGVGGEQTRLKIVPLFESEAALRDSVPIMSSLLAQPVYQAVLAGQDHEQEVMIGYSDSNKELGYLGSSWALYTTQVALTELFQSQNVRHVFFHGRGGSVGRGGGPTNMAILALPAGTVGGRLKLTEQGEVISARYAVPEIAHRELELVLSAALVSSAPAHADRIAQPSAAEVDRYEAIMAEMARHAVSAYQRMVYQEPDFVEFFQAATPIAEISRLQLGSRPARRTASTRIADLRAIPWVFAWTQARILLPGWFGLGSGLAAGIEHCGFEAVREMHARWPYFQTVLANAELALAKADRDIAQRYVALVDAPELRDRIWSLIEAEMDLTVRQLLLVTGQTELLAADPVLQRSVRRRNPYVDPLSFIQVELLGRLRERPNDLDTLRAVLLTINGIAGGLKNTG